MKYVSIDIETGGLSSQHHSVLEVGIALADENGVKKDDGLHRLVVVPPGKELGHMNVWACRQHAELLKLIEQADEGRLDEEGWYDFDGDLTTDEYSGYFCRPNKVHHLFAMTVMTNEWVFPNPEAGTLWKVNLAGKNVATFDLPFLAKLPDWRHGEPFSISRRVLDPSVLYSRPDDLVLPDLAECLERAGLNPSGLHTAVGDALDVVRLLTIHYQAEGF